MLPSPRERYMDVSNTVDVTSPAAVAAALRLLLDSRYPGFDFSAIDTLVGDFGRLYTGEYPGYRACDIGYHNIQHVLDVTLAMARLIDGHDLSCAIEDKIGPEFALGGIATALFHDAGYIQRTGDHRYSSGAAYTRVHVRRSARFLSEYLPTVGLASLAPLCKRIVHFTSHEISPDEVRVKSSRERTLGGLLGTADLIAQMADVEYVRKCRDDLYVELEVGGLAGECCSQGYDGIIFRSPQHLLESTPNFIRTAIKVRLDGYFNGAYKYAAAHFKGPNLYMDAIDKNRRELECLLAQSS